MHKSHIQEVRENIFQCVKTIIGMNNNKHLLLQDINNWGLRKMACQSTPKCNSIPAAKAHSSSRTSYKYDKTFNKLTQEQFSNIIINLVVTTSWTDRKTNLKPYKLLRGAFNKLSTLHATSKMISDREINTYQKIYSAIIFSPTTPLYTKSPSRGNKRKMALRIQYTLNIIFKLLKMQIQVSYILGNHVKNQTETEKEEEEIKKTHHPNTSIHHKISYRQRKLIILRNTPHKQT